MAGKLHICATPIGNLADISPRLREVLGSVDSVYAEDTRRARTLLDAAGVRADVRSHFAGNEAQRSQEIAQRLADGAVLAVLTDAGMPVVSDPGAMAVHAAFAVGASVSVVAGPSAVTAALAVSGFSGDRFVFESFLPRKKSERTTRLGELASEERTMVIFATPHRLVADLADLVATFGSAHRLCVARELTKLHEEVVRTTLGEALATWSERKPRGEYTLVIEGAEPVAMPLDRAVAIAEQHMEDGESRSSASRLAAHETGADRRQIYEGLGSKSKPNP